MTGENLKLVFLTHGHVDHVGNAQVLRRFGMEGAAVSLRGHTPGSMGLIIGGHIFTGDASMDLLGRTSPPVFGDNAEEMRAALKKITKYKKGNLHNGH